LGLSLGLHITEVRVAFKVAALFLSKSLECSVSSYFVRFGKSHGALGKNMAVVLNSKDGVEESVNFLQVNLNDFNDLFFTRGEGVEFLGLLSSGSFLLSSKLGFSWWGVLDGDENGLRVSQEHTGDAVNSSPESDLGSLVSNLFNFIFSS
jgi:hypothetical protein